MQSPSKSQLSSSQLERAILKFIWNNKKSKIAKTILHSKRASGGISIPGLKQYYKAIVSITAWYWYWIEEIRMAEKHLKKCSASIFAACRSRRASLSPVSPQALDLWGANRKGSACAQELSA